MSPKADEFPPPPHRPLPSPPLLPSPAPTATTLPPPPQGTHLSLHPTTDFQSLGDLLAKLPDPSHPWYPGGLGEEERRREESRRERMEEEYFEDWRAIAPPNQQPRASAPTEASPKSPRAPSQPLYELGAGLGPDPRLIHLIASLCSTSG